MSALPVNTENSDPSTSIFTSCTDPYLMQEVKSVRRDTPCTNTDRPPVDRFLCEPTSEPDSCEALSKNSTAPSTGDNASSRKTLLPSAATHCASAKRCLGVGSHRMTKASPLLRTHAEKLGWCPVPTSRTTLGFRLAARQKFSGPKTTPARLARHKAVADHKVFRRRRAPREKSHSTAARPLSARFAITK